MYAALAPKPVEKKMPSAPEPAVAPAGPGLSEGLSAGSTAGAPHFLRLLGGNPPHVQRRAAAPPVPPTTDKDEDVLPLQAKLEVNKPGDFWEQEADGVAAVVQRQPDAASGQGKASVAPPAAGSMLPLPDPGAPLSGAVRERVEPVLGADLGGVRVHASSQAQAEARALQARAFTHRGHIWLGPGQSADDIELMAHEATHVVQQGAASPAGPPGIQRDPLPGASPSVPASMPGPNASTVPPKDKGPAAPQGATIPFEGVALAPDSAWLRSQLEQIAATKGEAAASTFAWRFINMDWAQKASLEAQHGKELVDEIQMYLREEINRLEFDNKEFLKQLEQKATAVTRELLANSKAQIEKELAHYGITETQVGDSGGGPATTAYRMSNEAAGKGLQVAAGEMAVKRRLVDEAGQQSIAAREAVEKAAQANPFLIPPALQETAESLRKTWQEAEKEYTELANTKQAEFPILAAYSTGPGSAGRLEQLARQGPASLAQSIGETAHERLNNIQTVESELGGRFNVWSQQRMLDLAMRQMNATPMQSRVAADNVAKVKADAESSKMLFGLLAVGLGLLAAIPTGGSSLLAGIAAAAAVMGAGLSLYAAYEEAQNYALASAATGTDFDKAKAISQEDPSLLWLAIDIVSAVADVYGAAAAFKALRTALLAAKAKGGIEGMKDLVWMASRTRLPASSQGRLLAQAFGGSGKVDETLKAVRQIYRNLPRPGVDEELAKAFKSAAEWYLDQGKVLVVPPGGEGRYQKLFNFFLEHGFDKLNASRGAKSVMGELAKGKIGLHNKEFQLIILEGGASPATVADVLAHEMSHGRQAVIKELDTLWEFEKEYQALIAEREFLKLLPPDILGTVDPNTLQLLHATDDQVMKIAAQLNPNLPQLPNRDAPALASLIIKHLRTM
ncbi:MAG TPA: hypothetical protein DD490_16600 [Acidobacteria bacterium]|nr:hypothetical protein [Acidobacteriota bacterium]